MNEEDETQFEKPPTYELTAEDLGIDENVVVETMPDQHRDSHRAAGNWGCYPCNGAERRIMPRSDAEELCSEDEDGYDHIVEDS